MTDKTRAEKAERKHHRDVPVKAKKEPGQQTSAETVPANLEDTIRRIVGEVIDEKLKAVYEYIYQLEDEMPDPDEGKRLNPDLEKRLKAKLEEPLKRGKPLSEYLKSKG